jgi:tetratricopeptide (TPR) repeat protein
VKPGRNTSVAGKGRGFNRKRVGRKGGIQSPHHVPAALGLGPVIIIMESLTADDLKDLGNECFVRKDFIQAITFFTEAINIDEQNAKYFLNRSLAYASLGQWIESARDARKAIQLDPKYTKAHCRHIKALIELQRYKEARVAVTIALRDCEENNDLKSLEKQIVEITGIPIRPKSTDFEVIKELGDGNFSKVYKVIHKITKMEFAVKVLIIYICSYFKDILFENFLYDSILTGYYYYNVRQLRSRQLNA